MLAHLGVRICAISRTPPCRFRRAQNAPDLGSQPACKKNITARQSLAMTAKLLIPARGFHAAAMRANMRSRRRPGEEWLNLALGVWAILAPWLTNHGLSKYCAREWVTLTYSRRWA